MKSLQRDLIFQYQELKKKIKDSNKLKNSIGEKEKFWLAVVFNKKLKASLMV